MPQDIILPTLHELQTGPHTCGPACINMVLSFWSLQQPQATVWAEVQAHTFAKRPSDARPQPDQFYEQRCEQCSSKTTIDPNGSVYGDYSCWYTTPEALATTLNLWSPQGVMAEYFNGAVPAISRIVESISGSPPVPAVMAIQPALHWVVAVGYQIDGPGTSVIWNGIKITGLYVRDPAMADPGQDTLQLRTLDGLRRPLDGLLMAVECGTKAGTYPVVARPSISWLHWKVVMIISSMRIVRTWIDRWKYWKYWRQVRKPVPGPPPRSIGKS